MSNDPFRINPWAWRLVLIALNWASACLLYGLFVWMLPPAAAGP